MDSIPDEFLFVLITGCYGFVGVVVKWAIGRFDRVEEKIDKIDMNHLKHIMERLARLEKIAGKDADRDEFPPGETD